MLEAGDLTPERAKMWENRVELGLSVLAFGSDGVVMLRNVSKSGQMLEDTFDLGKTDINPLEIMEATNKAQLIDDLVNSGAKITPGNVVDIRNINGQTVWLETGNANSGLRHIVGEHGPEFTQRGISEADIPDVVFTALQRNNVVGYQGRGTGRPIYEFDYGGQTHRLAITVGDNGFVVGANFR